MAREIHHSAVFHSGSALVRALQALLICLIVVSIAQIRASQVDSDPTVLQLRRSVTSNYAEIVFATYHDSLATAKALKSAIDSFLALPSDQNLRAARHAWREARVFYSQSEAFRFYDGPIDQVDASVNAWPIDENYIDYVAENPNAGVINAADKFPTLSRGLILSLNEKEGKKNISTGFHAIEFLLWGQDRSAMSAGERSWRDYTQETPNSARRGDYLRLIAELLVEQLEALTLAWAETNGNYRSEFVRDPDVALGKILKGIGALSGPELAGERLTVPYETKEQEDEQSCFSDNTRDDIVNDAIGIHNVFYGQYRAAGGRMIRGPGVYDLLRRIDPGFAEKVSIQVEATVAAAKKIQQPFDQAILGANTAPGRVAVKQAIVAFQMQSDLIAQAAKTLSVKLEP